MKKSNCVNAFELGVFYDFFPYKIIVILKKQGFAKYMHHLKYPDELTITHNMELHADFFLNIIVNSDIPMP